MDDDNNYKKTLPPPVFEKVYSLPCKKPIQQQQQDGLITEDGHLPKVAWLLEETCQRLESTDVLDSVVLAGEGEPTLRLEAVLGLARHLQERKLVKQRIPIRLVTNGLGLALDEACVGRLQKAGIFSVSVAIMTACPNQYDALMSPCLPSFQRKRAHECVCEFVRQCLQHELDVELTGVDRPDVDKKKAQELAVQLGVTRLVRWRPYFP